MVVIVVDNSKYGSPLSVYFCPLWKKFSVVYLNTVADVVPFVVCCVCFECMNNKDTFASFVIMEIGKLV